MRFNQLLQTNKILSVDFLNSPVSWQWIEKPLYHKSDVKYAILGNFEKDTSLFQKTCIQQTPKAVTFLGMAYVRLMQF